MEISSLFEYEFLLEKDVESLENVNASGLQCLDEGAESMLVEEEIAFGLLVLLILFGVGGVVRRLRGLADVPSLTRIFLKLLRKPGLRPFDV